MKRIVICCDGTWNELDFRVRPVTNVVKMAQAVHDTAPGPNGDTIHQVVFYDEGVGTLEGESIKGGAFGNGLNQNVIDAYTFLVLNYLPGDELYLFGFSRGAYTVRSLVGMIRNSGIVRRGRVPYVPDAFKLYKRNDIGPNDDEARAFRRENGHQGQWLVKEDVADGEADPALRISIDYLGVWDTVGSRGVPNVVNAIVGEDENHGFHDLTLSSIVQRARHAVAIDEFRSVFSPTLWEKRSIDFLNSEEHSAAQDPDNPPFQQRWFPGDHGSVGGGGDETGLSDHTLAWIADGARQNNAGLSFDANFEDVRFDVHAGDGVVGRVRFHPTLDAPLSNVSTSYTSANASMVSRLFNFTMDLVQQDRIGSLESLDDIHENAKNYRGHRGRDIDYVKKLYERILAYTPRQRISTAELKRALPPPPNGARRKGRTR